MDLREAMSLHHELVEELQSEHSMLAVERYRSPHYRPRRFALAPGGGIALGVTLAPGSGYAIAIRVQENTPSMRELADHISKVAHGESETRIIGRVRAQGTLPQTPTLPLRPGLSIGHPKSTAGTLGGFIRIKGVTGLCALSNNHVLAATNRGRCGDPILQPGRSDGGRPERDRIGRLHAFERLRTAYEPPNEVDAAVCLLDELPYELPHLASSTSAIASAVNGDEVEKIGKSSLRTVGRVTAVNVTLLNMDYRIGALRFDGVTEVQGTHEPFSRDGDSGSLVRRSATGEAVGLLFGGRVRGADNGLGVSYLCNLDATLKLFGEATLVG
ncbi:hypothetical protein ACWEC4_21840 [Streptomyces sp. NPDC005055]